MDTDKDKVANCIDQCPNDMKKTKSGVCGCGTADKDMDNDGTMDCQEEHVLMINIRPYLVCVAVTRPIPTRTWMALLTAWTSVPKI